MLAFHLPDLAAELCYHDLAGSEPAWVYLHGMGSASSADFPAVVRQPLLTPYHALLIDLLGFGFSDRPDGFSYSLEAQADAVARLLEHLRVRDCHLVGHSSGGSVAIALAASRPDPIASLVVAEPNLDPEDATLSRIIVAHPEEAYVAAGHTNLIAQAEVWVTEGTDVPATYAKTLRMADPRAMHRSAVAMMSVALREVFFDLRIPRTYVYGALTLPHRHEAFLRTSRVPVAVVPGVGHAMMDANPDGAARVLSETLP
jgi:pimeloyl-ACP methyl ester carboxylesterase